VKSGRLMEVEGAKAIGHAPGQQAEFSLDDG
jgi:hypothetical protein